MVGGRGFLRETAPGRVAGPLAVRGSRATLVTLDPVTPEVTPEPVMTLDPATPDATLNWS